MKLLLHGDVEKLGHVGDVVEVNEGYARNYLIPQLLGVEPTKANIEAIAEEKTRQAELRRLARVELEASATKVNDAEVTIVSRVNEQGHLFGSVGEAEILAALHEKGFTVQAKHIVLDGHIRETGTFDVRLRFASDIEATVHVAVVGPEDEGGDHESESESTAENESGTDDDADAEW